MTKDILWVAICSDGKMFVADNFREADDVSAKWCRGKKLTRFLREYIDTSIGLPQLLRQAAIEIEKRE